MKMRIDKKLWIGLALLSGFTGASIALAEGPRGVSSYMPVDIKKSFPYDYGTAEG